MKLLSKWYICFSVQGVTSEENVIKMMMFLFHYTSPISEICDIYSFEFSKYICLIIISIVAEQKGTFVWSNIAGKTSMCLCETGIGNINSPVEAAPYISNLLQICSYWWSGVADTRPPVAANFTSKYVDKINHFISFKSIDFFNSII